MGTETKTETKNEQAYSLNILYIIRFGETFSGIYYENGQITNYFFSNKIGALQT